MHKIKEIKHFFFKSYKYLCQSTIAQRSIELLHVIEGTVYIRFYSFSAGRQSADYSSKSTFNLIRKHSKIQAMPIML